MAGSAGGNEVGRYVRTTFRLLQGDIRKEEGMSC